MSEFLTAPAAATTKASPISSFHDVQELNREANTLSSKSVVANTTRCAVELKVLIEQLSEQIHLE